MTLREYMNERPGVAYGGAGGLVIAGVVATILSLRGGSSGASSSAYFSDDDGKSFFADARTKRTPFDHGGKQAVRAIVYEAGGTRFVNYLQRDTPEGQRLLNGAAKPAAAPGAGPALSEVKRPGEATWVGTDDMSKASAVMTLRLPASVTGPAVPVEP